MGKTKRIDIDVELVCKRYLSGESSSLKLAKEFNVSIQTILRRLIESGVEIRNGNPPKIPLDIEIISKQYINEMSAESIADQFNVSRSTIINRLKEAGVEIRTSYTLSPFNVSPGDTTKTCPKCMEEQPISNFGIDNSVYDNLTRSCKNCIYLYEKERSHIHDAWLRNRYEIFQVRISNIKMEKGCTDCGYNLYADALDFDHLPGNKKSFQISRCGGSSWERVLQEMDKCEIVCANCHRIRTSDRRPPVKDEKKHHRQRIKVRAWMAQIKMESGDVIPILVGVFNSTTAVLCYN